MSFDDAIFLVVAFVIAIACVILGFMGAQLCN